MILTELSRQGCSCLAKRTSFLIGNFSRLSTTNLNRASSDDQLKVFRDNATKWWNGKEFSILRSMNELRVPFIVDGLGKPMNESKLMDVGCGGGILSEPLARLGANVLGIDPVFESINQAQLHASTDPELTNRLRYRNCNIEDLSSQPEHIEAYDGLVASEVVEHIEDIESFLKHCTKVIKPHGSLFITTINQTPLAWLGVIFFGEYVLQQLPKGTHTYDMFVSVKGLRVMLERLGYRIKLVNGFMYEPIGGNFYWTPSTLTHYALQAIKVAPMSKGINHQQKRHMAKSKSATKLPPKPKHPLDNEDMKKVIPIDVYKQKVTTIVSEFREHLETRLTIRASTSSIETLKIEIEGLDEPLELRDIAQLSMKGANLMVINLSTMPDAIKSTVKALSQLGDVSPQVEVNNIYVPIPRITTERRENLAKAAKQASNQAKEKLRGLFSEFASKAKGSNEPGVSKDLMANTVENLQYDLNLRILEVDELLKSKVSQLLVRNDK